ASPPNFINERTSRAPDFDRRVVPHQATAQRPARDRRPAASRTRPANHLQWCSLVRLPLCRNGCGLNSCTHTKLTLASKSGHGMKYLVDQSRRAHTWRSRSEMRNCGLSSWSVFSRAETRSIDIRTLQQTRAKAAPHVFRLPIVQKICYKVRTTILEHSVQCQRLIIPAGNASPLLSLLVSTAKLASSVPSQPLTFSPIPIVNQATVLNPPPPNS